MQVVGGNTKQQARSRVFVCVRERVCVCVHSRARAAYTCVYVRMRAITAFSCFVPVPPPARLAVLLPAPWICVGVRDLLSVRPSVRARWWRGVVYSK